VVSIGKNGDALGQHVFGQTDHNRPRAAIGGGIKRARNQFRYARRIVDFRHPFAHRAEHGTIVDFLKCFALGHVARYLTDEHDERR
jgi:hypothetical protein